MTRPKPATVLILGMFALGCASAVAAIWYRHNQSARVLAEWGGPSAQLIARAPQVEAWRFADSTARDSGDSDGAGRPVVARARAETATGLVHVRQALVDDETFEWSIPAQPEQPHWAYALHFADGAQELTLLFDLQSGWVAIPNGRRLRLKPRAAEGLGAFFETLFESREGPANEQR